MQQRLVEMKEKQNLIDKLNEFHKTFNIFYKGLGKDGGHFLVIKPRKQTDDSFMVSIFKIENYKAE